MTKLNKLLYYLDFIHYRDKKTSVTGDIYIHQEFGPVPVSIDLILAGLRKNNEISTREKPHLDGKLIEFYLEKNTKLDESVFSPYQKKLLKNICDEFAGWQTEKVVAQTHLEAPWFYSKPLEVVDFEYANDIEFFQS